MASFAVLCEAKEQIVPTTRYNSRLAAIITYKKCHIALDMTFFSLLKKLEAPPRFELGIKDLQSHALPLGYGAELNS